MRPVETYPQMLRQSLAAVCPPGGNADNPTVAVLEERVASLEGARAGCAVGSGHAAQFLTFATMLDPGDEFLASRALYGGSLTQFGLSFKKLGWHCHFVDPNDPENFRRAPGHPPFTRGAPMSTAIIRRALLSVSDKAGLIHFARFLHDARDTRVDDGGGTARLRDEEISD